MSLDAAQGARARSEFIAAFPGIVDMLVADLQAQYDVPAPAVARIRRSLEYNVPHGKLNRGLAVRACHAAFAQDATGAGDAHLLGWCVELLQAFFLVADDIMDDSVTRRGQPCFYRVPDIGLQAINDSLMLEAMIFRVLRLRFKSHPAYVHLVELFMDITYTTELGQMLDLTSNTRGKLDLDQFSEEMLARIYKYKTSHYSFYLPVALGMRLAGVEEEEKYAVAKKICLELGYYFQAQDDFIDCFGDPAVTGKVGTDIEECTCTWLVVRALERVTPEQRHTLETNYGSKEPEKVQAVKDLYRELKLHDVFAEFEKSSHNAISKMIADIKEMPTDAFEFLLAKLYKRSK